MQIDAVEQRPREPGLIALQHRRRAHALMLRIALKTARTGMRVSFPTFLKHHGKRTKSKFHMKLRNL
jgi:hypothetical protein